MPDAASRELRDFFNYIWGEDAPVEGKPAYVYLPTEYQGEWRKVFFAWPRQREAVLRHVLKWTPVANVFYSPAVFKRANPEKDNVLGAQVLWVDFDGNAPVGPVDGIPAPTLVMQSSIEGHEHWYWKLDSFVTGIELLEDRNRALAYTFGADTSGWDADQILRPPVTINHKRNKPVQIKAWDR